MLSLLIGHMKIMVLKSFVTIISLPDKVGTYLTLGLNVRII
jgi:hypothetical protein